METDETVESRNEAQNKRPNILVRLVNLLGVAAIAGTVLAFGTRQFWIADVAAQFRVQYLGLLMPGIVLWLVKRRFELLIVGGLALAINARPVIPYFISQGDSKSAAVDATSRGQTPLRLLVMNVLRTNEQFEETLQGVVGENADFVYLMEVQPDWQPLLEDLKDRYPHQKLLCREDYTGVAFLSKYAWDDLEIVHLDDLANHPLDIRFPRLEKQRAGFRLIATHPLPPFGAKLTDSRDRQLKELGSRFQLNQANLLCGDFNLTPWSPRFNDILVAGQLRDASLGYGVSPTLTPLPTVMGGLKVDHVLVNRRVVIAEYRLGTDSHSDHQRLVVDFHVVDR